MKDLLAYFIHAECSAILSSDINPTGSKVSKNEYLAQAILVIYLQTESPPCIRTWTPIGNALGPLAKSPLCQERATTMATTPEAIS